MRLILDTHALVWWFTNDARLPRSVHAAITEAEVVFASAVAAWEIATKHRIGKWPEVGSLAVNLSNSVARADFTELAITVAHGVLAGSMPGPHRDPFDRMLMAQSALEDAILVTADRVFAAYKTRTLWG